MSWLNHFLSSELIYRMGYALFHSLWQGVLVALLLAGALAVIPKTKSSLRYWCGCIALFALPVLFCATAALVGERENVIGPIVSETTTVAMDGTVTEKIDLSTSGVGTGRIDEPVLEAAADIEPAEVPASATSWRRRLSDTVKPWTGHVVLCWFVGVFAMSVWNLGGWIAVRRLRCIGISAVSERFVAMLGELAGRLGVKHSVRLLQSAVVQSPMTIGWLKPMILVPASILCELSPRQIELILAHELAHIRRFDYLVNLLQTVVETLLFHHPAVWWISHKIRSERECCCDDMVVKLTSDELNYAKALTAIADLRRDVPQLAVAATGGSLLSRIQRILGLSNKKSLSGSTWLASLLALVICIAAAVSIVNAATAPPRDAAAQKLIVGKADARAGEIIGRIIESEKQLGDVQAHVKWFEPDPYKPFKEYDWGFEGEKEYIEGLEYSSRRKEPTKMKRTYDGKEQRSLFYYEDKEFPGGMVGDLDPQSFTIAMTPKALLGHSIKQGTRETLGQVLAKAKQVTVREKTEQVDGRDCIVLEAVGVFDTDIAYDVRVWIDPERGYRPLKIEQFRSPDCKMILWVKERWQALWKRVADIKLERIDGVWFPVRGDRYYFEQELQEPDGMSIEEFRKAFGHLSEEEAARKIRHVTVPGYHRRIEIDNVKINRGIAADKFRIEFSKGSEVWDETRGNRYIVGEDSQRYAGMTDGEIMAEVGKLGLDELIDIIEHIIGKRGEVTSKRKCFAAVKRLVEIGSPTVERLSDEIRKTDSVRQQRIMAFVLRAIGDTAAVDALIDALERSGFSSDYGIGDVNGELSRFMHRNQIDPSKESLGLGRPVREITIALEKLTGHSEGHDHFNAFDSDGKKLGSHTVTPEIRDRERAHRSEVAGRWRKWWQKKQSSKRPGVRGVLAAREGSLLEFHVVPETGGDWPELSADAADLHRVALSKEGPYAGSIRGDSYQWFRVDDDFKTEGFIVGQYKGEKYVLLCARAKYSMWPDGKWGLQAVSAGKDLSGRPTVSFRLDDSGGELFYALTSNNIGNRLAMIINGKVYSAPRIQVAIRDAGVITGQFTQTKVEELVRMLKKGMPPLAGKSAREKAPEQPQQPLPAISIAPSIETAAEALIGKWKCQDVPQVEAKRVDFLTLEFITEHSGRSSEIGFEGEELNTETFDYKVEGNTISAKGPDPDDNWESIQWRIEGGILFLTDNEDKTYEYKRFDPADQTQSQPVASGEADITPCVGSWLFANEGIMTIGESGSVTMQPFEGDAEQGMIVHAKDGKPILRNGNGEYSITVSGDLLLIKEIGDADDSGSALKRITIDERFVGSWKSKDFTGSIDKQITALFLTLKDDSTFTLLGEGEDAGEPIKGFYQTDGDILTLRARSSDKEAMDFIKSARYDSGTIRLAIGGGAAVLSKVIPNPFDTPEHPMFRAMLTSWESQNGQIWLDLDTGNSVGKDQWERMTKPDKSMYELTLDKGTGVRIQLTLASESARMLPTSEGSFAKAGTSALKHLPSLRKSKLHTTDYKGGIFLGVLTDRGRLAVVEMMTPTASDETPIGWSLAGITQTDGNEPQVNVLTQTDPVEKETVEIKSRRVTIPDADTKNVPTILDLAGGEMLPFPDDIEGVDLIGHFTKLGKGDLLFDRLFAVLRGGKAQVWKDGQWTLLTPEDRQADATAYKLPGVPCRLLVITGDGKQFDVTVLAKTKDGGIEIEYKPVGAKVTMPGKEGAHSATHTMEYTVKPGDTLAGISEKVFGTTKRYPEIMKLNGLEKADSLRAGMVLKLP